MIKINELNINLKVNQTLNYYLKPTNNFVIEFDKIDSQSQKTMFIGFPEPLVNVRNISHKDLIRLKNKLKQGYAITIMYKIIECLYDYDQFVVLTNAIDPLGIEFLSDMSLVMQKLSKKIFIILLEKGDTIPIFSFGKV